MGLLLFTARVNELIRRKHDLELQVSEATRKYEDCQRFASQIASGDASIWDLLSLPATMVGRAAGYMAYMDYNARQWVMQNAPGYEQWYMQQQAQNGGAGDYQAAMQARNYIYQQLYRQAQERIAQVNQESLKEEEKQLATKKDQLETELNEVNQELDAVKKARNDSIKDIIPNFGGQ